ncbi:MAG: M20 family metallopeptidase [Thermanaerothrix sp.]|nr:M20 family metallopeptidase [Thermanaerothrix sp.]
MIKDDRANIHRRPELGMEVFETASFVARRLEELGAEVHRNVGVTGVVGMLRGYADGPVVALRADMDALPIQEDTGLPFSSEVPGVMHACGHDVHTAVLLGAARILSALREEWRGTVKLVFQPAEECAPSGGALAMIEDGVLSSPQVQAMLALHVWPDLPTGSVGLREGPIMGASDRVDLVVRGRSAHGSAPDQGVDAIVIAAQVISALQTLISRSISPSELAVLTFGAINGGNRYNVLADQVRLEGTLRTVNPDLQEKLPHKIRAISSGVASAMGGSCEVLYSRGYPPTINDPGVVRVLRGTVVDLLGSEGLVLVDSPSLGGEDFSFFASQVPSSFLWLGCRPKDVAPEDFPPLHNPGFAPEEDCMPIGAALMAQGAMDLLEALESEGGLTSGR